jgi:Ser/Thr protein kinase RdoA (MazF antagonist)
MENLEGLLLDNYNLKVNSIADAPRGFIAETYNIQTDDDCYFLKILKKNRHSVNILNALPALKQLRNLGVDYINYPIQTTDNRFCLEREDKYLILFNYIKGENTRDYDVEEVYKRLIDIHKLSGKITEGVNKEDFSIIYSERFEETLRRYEGLGIIKENFVDIWRYWNEFKELSMELSQRKFKLFLTHGDAFGNIIKDGKELYIIDWDDLILAPLERDLWFFVSNGAVVNLYKEAFEDFSLNQTLIKYYITKRFFEDLLGFMELLDVKPRKKSKAEILKDIEKDCFDWTYKLMKEF